MSVKVTCSWSLSLSLQISSWKDISAILISFCRTCRQNVKIVVTVKQHWLSSFVEFSVTCVSGVLLHSWSAANVNSFRLFNSYPLPFHFHTLALSRFLYFPTWSVPSPILCHTATSFLPQISPSSSSFPLPSLPLPFPDNLRYQYCEVNRTVTAAL